MKTYLKCTWVYLLILVLCTATSALAASFTADLVTTKKGKTETGKFFLLDQSYRMEILEDGKPVVVLADRGKKIHRILNMEEKVFFEISSDDFRVLSNDPFKASEYMAAKYESKVEGNEKINGINCERQAVTAQGKKIHSRWFSNELKFPVKLVSYEGDKEIYIAELRNIKKSDLQMSLFAPPAGFKQEEEPGAAAKRKLDQQIKAEEALPGLTGVKSVQVPCYVKIAAGGELRIQMDTERKAYLEIANEANGESEFTLLHYRNGKPLESHAPKTGTLERKGYRKSWDFNDEFSRKTGSFVVDEVMIRVEEGLVYAKMSQQGPDRTDSYNRGGQTDHRVDPKRPVTVRITGDNPFGDQTTGKFWLRYDAGGSSEAIPFTVETGKTRTWDYPADEGINTLAVSIPTGDGRAKITLVQPPDTQKAAPKQSTVKKAPKPQYTPKAKSVAQFTVTHPSGTGKPLTPGKDLVITVTGISGDASGEIFLYSDRKKSKKIDAFKFKLKKGQAESFAVPGEKEAGWASVWVHKGSFKVKLDQSPDAKAAPAPKTTLKSIAPAPAPASQPTPKSASAVAKTAPKASSVTILNGTVPLMEGTKVLKTKTYGANSKADLEVPATPEEIVDFYKQTMTEKGWKPGMSMVQGNKGVLQLMGSGGQLIIKAQEKGQISKVTIALMGQ